jgi:putative inorganic carbon (HCO3(-)) transporter
MGLQHSGLAPFLLYITGLAVFFLSAFWRAEIGMYYIIPLIPMQTLRYKLHQFPLGAEWIDLMLLGTMIGIFRKGDTLFTKTPVRKWVSLLLVWSYFSLWRGVLFLGSSLPLWFNDSRLSDWKNYMVIFLLFFVVLASIKNQKQMQILLILISLSLLVVNRNYINLMRGRDFSSFSYDMRDDGGMGYAGVNGLAALEAQLAVFLLGLYSVYKKRLPKLGSLILAGTCIVALMYTLSRGGYIAILVGSLFVGIMNNKKFLLILGLFLLTWQTLVPNAVRERVFMTTDSSGQLESSANERVTLWTNAVEIIKGNPAIGTGFDTYKFMHAVGPYEDTHNYYVKVMVEMGLPGLITFLGILGALFSAGYGLYKSEQSDDFMRGLGLGLAGMVIATAVANAFGDRWTYIEETGFMWVIAAMAVRGRMLGAEAPLVEKTTVAMEGESKLGKFERARDLALGWNSRTQSR